MKHASLFSGIGGFDLAAEWMGWTNVFNCEIDSFCRKVLNYYWPDTESYTDIKTTSFRQYEGKIDILTGGFPCQGFSYAGKRKGKDDNRYLWPYMLRTIRQVKPTWVIGENVPGIINLALDTVLSDLEKEGYTCQTFNIPACAVNAPHRRSRIWIVAYSICNNDTRKEHRSYGKEETISQFNRKKNSSSWESCGTDKNNVTSNSSINRYSTGYTEERRIFRESQKGRVCKSQRTNFSNTISNTINKRLQRSKEERNIGIKRKKQEQQSSRCICTNWQNFPTQPPICSRDDELSTRLFGITFPKHRNESIKAYGNAVVPALVYEIFKIIEHYDYKINA